MTTNGFTLSTLFPSLIRTYVPIGVGALLSWLLTLGIELDAATSAALIIFLTGLLQAIYYTIVRLLEQRFPGIGVLLGLPKSPDSYSNANTIPGDIVQDLPAYPTDGAVPEPVPPVIAPADDGPAHRA